MPGIYKSFIKCNPRISVPIRVKCKRQEKDEEKKLQAQINTAE